MQLFLSAPFFGDDRNAAFVRETMSVLESSGHKVFCFMETVEHWGKVRLEPRKIYDDCLDRIKESDALVAIVDDNCPGIGVEVGMARALGKPVFTFIPRELKRVGAYIGCSSAHYILPEHDWPRFIAQQIPDKIV